MSTFTPVSVFKDVEIILSYKVAVDIFFVINQRNRRVRFGAHKAILASKSEVFESMFSGGLELVNDDIIITDATAENFYTFLRTFYHKDIIRMKDIAEMLRLADKFDAKECMSTCQQTLQRKLRNSRNAPFVMNLALRYDFKQLSEMCLQIFKIDSYAILRQDEFLNVSPIVLKHFVESIDVSEYASLTRPGLAFDICKACVRWAKKQCSEKEIDSDIRGNVQDQLNGFFQSIPFTHLKNYEIVDFIADDAQIFTIDELKSICRHISKKNKLDCYCY